MKCKCLLSRNVTNSGGSQGSQRLFLVISEAELLMRLHYEHQSFISSIPHHVLWCIHQQQERRRVVRRGDPISISTEFLSVLSKVMSCILELSVILDWITIRLMLSITRYLSITEGY